MGGATARDLIRGTIAPRVTRGPDRTGSHAHAAEGDIELPCGLIPAHGDPGMVEKGAALPPRTHLSENSPVPPPARDTAHVPVMS